jgi:hypothetical protein
MSRVRLSYVLAFFGILITTGGCSSSATAPEGANIEARMGRFSNPTSRDSVAVSSHAGSDEMYTTSSGLLNGGGRSADAP